MKPSIQRRSGIVWVVVWCWYALVSTYHVAAGGNKLVVYYDLSLPPRTTEDSLHQRRIHIDQYVSTWLSIARIYRYVEILQRKKLVVLVAADDADLCQHIARTASQQSIELQCDIANTITRSCTHIDMSSIEYIKDVLRKNQAIAVTSTLSLPASPSGRKSSRRTSYTTTSQKDPSNDIIICHRDDHQLPLDYPPSSDMHIPSLSLVLPKPPHSTEHRLTPRDEASETSARPTHIHMYYRSKHSPTVHVSLLKFTVDRIQAKFGNIVVHLTTDSMEVLAALQDHLGNTRLVFHDFVSALSLDTSIHSVQDMVEADFFLPLTNDLLANVIEWHRMQLSNNYCYAQFLVEDFYALDASDFDNGEEDFPMLSFYPAWCRVQYPRESFGGHFWSLGGDSHLVLPDVLMSHYDLLVEHKYLRSSPHAYQYSTYYALLSAQEEAPEELLSIDPTTESTWYMGWLFRGMIRFLLKIRFRALVISSSLLLLYVLFRCVLSVVMRYCYQPSPAAHKFRRL